MIRLSSFPPLVWVVLAGTLLTRMAFLMVWPFLAILLDREFELPPAQIGAILGSAFLASASGGFYAGNLSDRFGRRVLMIAGIVGETLAFVTLAMAGSVAAYAAGAFLVGLSRSVLEAPGKALIADHVGDRETRELAYHVRYFLINVGAAIGPLLGLWLGVAAQQVGFWIAAGVYGVFAVVFVWASQSVPDVVRPAAHQEASVRAALRVLARDHRFLLLLGAMLLLFSAYAQQESTLIQYLNLEGGDLAIRLVVGLIVTNAATIVLFQFPLLIFLRRYDLSLRTYVGLALFTVAFIAYAWLPVHAVVGWVAATWVLSIGEVILFPTLNIQVDRMAPDDLKGSYFGAASLSSLGFGVGPFVGGALLQYVGGPLTFSITAGTVGACALCYWWSGRVRGLELRGESNAAEDALRGNVAPRLEISMDPARLNLDLVHSHLNTTYWAKGRARDVVERSLRHSLCFGAYVEGEQVGFARVVSDRAVFAYLMDVFVLPEHQGQGIGKALVGAVVGHPDLRGLRLFALRTRDAQGLYRQFGFEVLTNPEWTMAIQAPEVSRAASGEEGRGPEEAGERACG